MYELHGGDGLVAPALIAAFEGWVSAGSVGTAAAEHIADEGTVIATFDPDALFDYRVNRPAIEFVEGTMTTVDWPEMTLRSRKAGGRDLLVLTGPEPNWNWQALGRALADLAIRLGIVEHISVGGIPSAVPHTMPTPLFNTASRADLIGDEERPPEGLLRVPGSMVSIVAHYLVETGVPAVGFWAQVPHYVGGTYYPGVVTLVERVSRHLGVEIPLGSLVDESAAQRQHLDSLVAAQPQAQEYVTKLETMAAAAGDVPSGEDIAAEIERFLAEANDAEDPFSDG